MSFFRKYKTAEELLPGFLLEKEIGILHKSYMTYSGQLPVFTDWLKENGHGSLPIKKITPETISDFFYYLGRDKGLDRPTVEKYFMNIRQLFTYAKKRGEVDNLPFDLVVFPRKKKDQGADVISNVHLKPLLDYIKEKDPQLFLACIIEYYCFIRPGKELMSLNGKSFSSTIEELIREKYREECPGESITTEEFYKRQKKGTKVIYNHNIAKSDEPPLTMEIIEEYLKELGLIK